ncbi:WAS/WASL-interacting protein family member 3 [Triticum aestivum]|uniref:WAS/WASL-interacting protein family member 3 n=1 Tax=Triticum aestivum TaxID=4565 RepID=UPI001D001B35|nr:WAS/WASL-interacting protein family member 3-like [Triticum aestivum]
MAPRRRSSPPATVLRSAPRIFAMGRRVPAASPRVRLDGRCARCSHAHSGRRPFGWRPPAQSNTGPAGPPYPSPPPPKPYPRPPLSLAPSPTFAPLSPDLDRDRGEATDAPPLPWRHPTTEASPPPGAPFVVTPSRLCTNPANAAPSPTDPVTVAWNAPRRKRPRRISSSSPSVVPVLLHNGYLEPRRPPGLYSNMLESRSQTPPSMMTPTTPEVPTTTCCPLTTTWSS